MQNIKTLCTPEIRKFIRDNVDVDTVSLANKAMPDPLWPKHDILNQIKARQKARGKLPDRADNFDLIMPGPDLVEQASSEATAGYKASLVKDLMSGSDLGNSFADLTAGAGIDTAAFARNFKSGFAVECDVLTSEVLRHNLDVLGTGYVQVLNCSAENFLSSFKGRKIDFIYLDPQRRSGSRRGRFEFKDCEPDVLAVLPKLLGNAHVVMIKTSPMLDIQKAAEDLGPSVQACHVVQWQGQVKELVLVLHSDKIMDKNALPVIVSSIDDMGQANETFVFKKEEEDEIKVRYSRPLAYLYEPSAGILKAGGFKTVAHRHSLFKLHPATHLYTSATPVQNFPGRVFEVLDILPVNKKKLQEVLPERQANLSTRNFPQNSDNLKKKLGLKDGGKIFIFACTLPDKDHALILCERHLQKE